MILGANYFEEHVQQYDRNCKLQGRPRSDRGAKRGTASSYSTAGVLGTSTTYTTVLLSTTVVLYFLFSQWQWWLLLLLAVGHHKNLSFLLLRGRAASSLPPSPSLIILVVVVLLLSCTPISHTLHTESIPRIYWFRHHPFFTPHKQIDSQITDHN